MSLLIDGTLEWVDSYETDPELKGRKYHTVTNVEDTLFYVSQRIAPRKWELLRLFRRDRKKGWKAELIKTSPSHRANTVYAQSDYEHRVELERARFYAALRKRDAKDRLAR